MTPIEFVRWLATVPAEDLPWIIDRVLVEQARRDVCEHGIVAGDWCAKCNAEVKAARAQTAIDPPAQTVPY